MSTQNSYVRKRDGSFQEINFSKIQNRLKYLANGFISRENRTKLFVKSPNENESKLTSLNEINIATLTQKVIGTVVNNVQTDEIDEISARICAELSHEHPDYDEMSSRIIISNHHKHTRTRNCLGLTEHLYINKLVHKEYYKFVEKNYERIEKIINYSRDYQITYFGFKTLEKSYFLKSHKDKYSIERPQDLMIRVAIAVGMNPIDPYCDKAWKHIEVTYNYMSQRYYTHASPTLFNAGTPKQQLLSCFLLGSEDSLEGIMKTATDMSKISKRAGGIGWHFNWRSSGALIKSTHGPSSGSIPFLQMYDKLLCAFNQGGKRKGSGAAYMSIDHPDIENFIECRLPHKKVENTTPDLFLAVVMRDLFMQRALNDEKWSLFDPDECPGLLDSYSEEYESLYLRYEQEGKAKKIVKARTLSENLARCRLESGVPYVWNIDMSNRKTNQKNLGTVRSSNLCVAPETLILTDKGHIEIQKLHGQKVNIWNGKEYSEVKVKKTGENQQMMKISFSDGAELKCTPYHKFYIKTGQKYTGKKDIIYSKIVQIIKAKDLEVGAKLIKCDYPTVEFKEDLKYAYTNGFSSGDGYYDKRTKEDKRRNNKSLEDKAYCGIHIDYQKNDEVSEICQGISHIKKPYVALYGEKIKLLDHLDYVSHGEEKNDRLQVKLTVHLREKFFVPMNYSGKSKMEWLSGYADADGCIVSNTLQIACIHKQFLLNIKLMLQTCGINAKVSKNRDAGKSCLPDGKGGHKYFDTKEVWRLLVASGELQKLIKYGFSPKRLKIDTFVPQRCATHFISITKIENLDEKSDTYCINEPKRHAAIFNGVITGQCAEIVEYSSSKEYAACTLASICLPRFVESLESEGKNNGGNEEGKRFNFQKLIEVARVAFKNLNRIIDINDYPVVETEVSNLRHRPVGLGVQGLADTYHALKLAFDSDEAKKLNKEIFETLYYAVMCESCELARKQYFIYKKAFKENGYAHVVTGCKIVRSTDKSTEEVTKYAEYTSTKYTENLPTTCGAYSSFEGSPMSQGKFQFDLWDDELDYLVKYNSEFAKYNKKVELSNMWDWNSLREKINKFGVRNSLCIALMPTASTSQIMGNTEAFEPITSNIYRRDTLAGQFICVNKFLIRELIDLGVWNKDVENNIILNNGSVQQIDGIPEGMKERYKTVWEISQKVIIDQAADRGPFVDQSQSMNLHLGKNKKSMGVVTSMDKYAWLKRLKTACYYLRTQDLNNPQKFSVIPDKAKLEDYNKKTYNIPTVNEENVCVSCSG